MKEKYFEKSSNQVQYKVFFFINYYFLIFSIIFHEFCVEIEKKKQICFRLPLFVN